MVPFFPFFCLREGVFLLKFCISLKSKNYTMVQDELFQGDVDPNAGVEGEIPLAQEPIPDAPPSEPKPADSEEQNNLPQLLKALNKKLAPEQVAAAVEGTELFLVHYSSKPIPATFDVLRSKCSGDGGEYGKHKYYHCTDEEALLVLVDALLNGE